MKTTIIYENSFGIISQWTGEVLEIKETTISIKLSPKKAYKFDLKANSEFMIVCKNKVSQLQLLNSEEYKNYWAAFDEKLRSQILSSLERDKNILHYWNGSNFNN